MQAREVGSALAQFNPARLVSTGAKIDKATLAKRPCFLCEKNRPSEQIVLSLEKVLISLSTLSQFSLFISRYLLAIINFRQ